MAKLTKLKLNEVSTVKAGANQFAEILLKKGAEMTDAVTVEKLAERLEVLEGELAVAKSFGSLSDAEKSHYASLSDVAKAEFLALESDARVREVAKAKLQDEIIQFEGQSIAKSAVGDQAFAVFKSLAKKAEDAEAVAKAEAELRELTELQAVAKDKFGALPGELSMKAKVLKAVKLLPEDVSKALESILVAGEAAMKAALIEKGSNHEVVEKSGTAKAYEEMQAQQKKGAK